MAIGRRSGGGGARCCCGGAALLPLGAPPEEDAESARLGAKPGRPPRPGGASRAALSFSCASCGKNAESMSQTGLIIP